MQKLVEKFFGPQNWELFTHEFYGTVTNYYENTGWKGTGVSDHVLAKQLDLFPNPVENSINIRMENELRGALSYEILTLQGKRVSNGVMDKTGDLLEFSVSGSDLSAGMYLFRIWSEDDVYISKFVKR